ncbi:MAG TPA: DoxX family membrane protein [Steroidobacteraceae bacterium]|jgi:uncharacterized membrane protein
MRNGTVYAIGAMLLGIVGLAVGDFALQWQPVPAAIPLRTPLSYVSAILLLVAGGAMLWTRTQARAALTLGCCYFLWAALLHVPRIFPHPADASMWLGFAEILALAAGGVAAWGMVGDALPRKLTVQTTQPTFGVCLLIFGWSHFVYADFTATMVPGWLPLPLFWAYATGCGHIAAGLALISGFASRPASTMLAGMFACFVVLLHVPRVLADPASRIEWTMLAVAISLTGAAWIVRTALHRHTNPLDYRDDATYAESAANSP